MSAKLTPDRIALAKRLRKRGLSIAAIARELGVSKSTAHSALEREPPRKLPVAPAVEPSAPAVELPVPSIDSLAAELAEQRRELADDVRRARTARDGDALNRAQRHLTNTTVVLARLTRDATPAEGVVHVTTDSITATAQECREALHELVARELQRQGEP